MSRPRPPVGRLASTVHPTPHPATAIIEQADASLLDVIDNLLNRGVVVSGELILGLAEVDLIYLQLSLLLVAADRVLLPEAEDQSPPLRNALRRGEPTRRARTRKRKSR